VFAVIIVVAAALFYFLRPVPPPSVSVALFKPDKVFVGEPFPVSVSISNVSAEVLKGADLTLELPPDVIFAGAPASQKAGGWPLGDVASGTTVSESSTLIALGASQSVAHLTLRATYSAAAAPKTALETDGAADVSIGEPAVGVALAAPASVVAGSELQLTAAYQNNTPDTLENFQLALTYPPAFAFESSSPMALSGGGIWNLGPLAPGASGTVAVTGVLTGVNSQSQASSTGLSYGFASAVNLIVASQTYSYSGPTANVTFLEPPLSLAISANGSGAANTAGASSYISSPKDFLSYSLNYANHSNVAFRNVSITAKLTGALFDFSSVDTTGAFSSLTDTVTWTPGTVPAFASLAPGASGAVTFRVRTLDAFPIRRASDQDFALRVDGTIASPTVAPGVAASSTLSTTALATKVSGSVALASKAFRYDTSSGLQNSGPYPPIVNQETQYTIHWTVTDTADALQNVVVSAPLPPGVSFTGRTRSNVSSTLQYDPGTGLVTWQIPSVPATAGLIAQAPQAVFQIADTPAVNQVGQYVSLLGQATLQATDVFTGQSLQASADQLRSDLSNDPKAAQFSNPLVQAQ
jgi:hypothetical protein